MDFIRKYGVKSSLKWEFKDFEIVSQRSLVIGANQTKRDCGDETEDETVLN